MLSIFRNGGNAGDVFISLVALIGSAMLSIIVHEYAHGYIALKNGDPTAKMNGRLTFNPKAHFDLIGLLMFLVVGIGWAKPVPINSNNFENYKKGVITTSLAGVIANLLLGFIMFGLSLIVIQISVVSNLNNQVVLILLKLFYNFFYFGTFISLALVAFNILPIFPLDGFRIVEALTKPNNGYVVFMRKYGTMVLLGLVVIGSIFSRAGIPQADILGMYVTFVSNGIHKLFVLIFGGAVGIL